MTVLPAGGRLVVVADGPLNALPFELLLTGNGPGGAKYLGLETAVVYAPSAQGLAILRRQGAGVLKPDRELLAIGDPVYSPADDNRCGGAGRACREPTGAELRQVRRACKSVAGPRVAAHAPKPPEPAGLQRLALKAGLTKRLCSSRAEARVLAADVPRGQADVLTDLAATKTRVLALLKDRAYRVLHFSTHGLLPEDKQCDETTRECLDQSALVLAATSGGMKDQMLTAKEVFESRIPAQVVTLSACRTGEGKLVRGEGILGMGQAFLYAGARAVVMSLWSVEEDSTAEWMKAFYRGMRAGKDLATAALEARRLVAAGGPDGKHPEWRQPFYWAPFVLSGLTE
jgi:CHAT domain-containing protein